MSRGAELWWERRMIWLPAASFVAVGVTLLVIYQVALSGRISLQAGAIEGRKSTLEEVARRRHDAEALVARARSTRAAIDELYAERLGDEASRLTAIMLEVKHLARQAGLGGMEAINYNDEQVQNLPLVRKSILFGAEGDYEQLRSFINLLELSPSFISLDEIHVEDKGDGRNLRLQVRLSTLFSSPDLPPRGAT
jgi:Tfp pilus assembly protein PilO